MLAFVGDELPGGNLTSYWEGVHLRRYGMVGAAAVVSTVGFGGFGTGANYCAFL